MKLWFEGDTLYYDIEYNGTRPQHIQQLGYIINSVVTTGNDAHVITDEGNYIVRDINDPSITSVTFDQHNSIENTIQDVDSITIFQKVTPEEYKRKYPNA